MERTELIKKMNLLKQKQMGVLLELITPAKAAANAMKDAGMKASSEPLFEALFKIDSSMQELIKFLTDNFHDIIELVIKGNKNA